MLKRPGRRSSIRLALAAGLLSSLSACTNGVDAGKQGGIAFIGFTVMLVITCVIMWWILGRDN